RRRLPRLESDRCVVGGDRGSAQQRAAADGRHEVTTGHHPSPSRPWWRGAWATSRAVASATVFMLKMLPIPSGPVDRVTKRPVVETLWLTTHGGRGEADLYRPPSGGPHPGVLVILGVVPAGVEHPLVTRSHVPALPHFFIDRPPCAIFGSIPATSESLWPPMKR